MRYFNNAPREHVLARLLDAVSLINAFYRSAGSTSVELLTKAEEFLDEPLVREILELQEQKKD